MARVMDLQAVDEGFGLLWRKHFIEGSGRVRMEACPSRPPLCSLRDTVPPAPASHEERPLLLRAMLGDFQAAFPRQRLIGNEEVSAALFLEGVVFPSHLSRLGWLRRILVFDEILAHLIQANPGNR